MALTQPRTRSPRIDVSELAHLPTTYVPLVSWQGDRVGYYADTTGRLELYVTDLATRTTRQVSHGQLPRALRTSFAWDRAGTRIFFGRDAAGNEQHDLFVIDVATGTVKQLTSGGLAEHHALEVSPDDQWLLVAANRRHPERPDRPGQMQLWRMRTDGTGLGAITDLPSPVWAGAHWSPDGGQIAFSSNEEMSDLKNADVYVIKADGTGLRRVFRSRVGAKDQSAEFHPDGRRLAVSSDATGEFRAGILDLASGDVRWLSDGSVEEHAIRFSDDGRWLVCVENHEAQVRPFLYDVATGARRELRLPDGSVPLQAAFSDAHGRFIDGDRKLLFMYATDTTRPALVSYDLASDTHETLVAPAYGSIDPSRFVPGEHVRYPTFDGQRVPAILYKPRDIAPGERLPAAIHVHGGPTGQWSRVFDPYAQLLADRGYVLLEPNIRGSTGYGVAWREGARKDWGGADLEDIAAGAAYLRSLPYVDPDRIAVFGGSYGGFSTFIAATKKPELWKAAVAMVGISDLHRMWDESKEHFRYFLRDQMGDPESDRALWRDRSAIEFAHQLRAKLLMIHGANDPRCPVGQSRIFRDRLLELGKREGVDFEYVEHPDAGHGSVDPDQKTRTLRILLDFLDRAM